MKFTSKKLEKLYNKYANDPKHLVITRADGVTNIVYDIEVFY